MTQVPVVIAGGGPVGMTLARALAMRGIGCLLAERNAATTSHPKMDITNARSMELFRALGLADALRAVAVPEDHAFDVAWITRFTGHQLHRFAYDGVTQARRRYRACNDGSQPAEPPMRVSQVEIEPVLRTAIEADARVQVRFGTAFEALQQDAAGVTVVLRRADGQAETVRCRYLVGCDGGGSAVREQLGIGLGGQARIMQRFMTHFRSPERALLQRWGVAWHHQSVWGTLIAQNDRDVWTLHTRVPPDVPVDCVDPAALVAQFVGRPIDMTVLVANPWSPHLLVADAYGRGRVLLAGDAVHQYIPTGGYGMNTGVADACDLAWKLAAVLHGFGGPALLASYEAERRPVGLRNRAASQRHNDVRLQIAQLYGPGLHADGAPGEHARAAAAARIAALGNAENESLGIELGYVYAGSPVLPSDADASMRDGADAPDDLHYRPTTRPGARLPNVFLADGRALHDCLGRWFTLLLFQGAPAGRAAALVQAAQALGVPLAVMAAPQRDWDALYAAEAVLVRPDQHVAWRGDAPAGLAQATTVLRRALGWLPAVA